MVYCHIPANVLPPCSHCTAILQPLYCRCTTIVLPLYLQCIATVLPAYNACLLVRITTCWLARQCVAAAQNVWSCVESQLHAYAFTRLASDTPPPLGEGGGYKAAAVAALTLTSSPPLQASLQSLCTQCLSRSSPGWVGHHTGASQPTNQN
jgi:hypothetical protein